MNKSITLIYLFSIIASNPFFGQAIYGDIFVTTHELLIDEPPCSCSYEPICGGTSSAQDAATFSFEGIFYGGGNPSILEKNPITCEWSWATPLWSTLNLAGLVSTSEGIFYAIEHPGSNNAVYEINIGNSTYSIIGNSPFPIATTGSDLCLYNGEVYYISSDGLVHLNITNPEFSELIQSFDNTDYYIGLTGSPWCNTLLATYEELGWGISEIRLINIIDGSISVLCQVHEHLDAITSMLEYTIPAPCQLMLDMDCNNDNSTTYFTCFTPDGVAIADSDIRLFSDDWVQEMTISIASPIPDAPFEILVMTGSIPNIDASGSGTDLITLTNLGGASIEDFKDAVHLIRYDNQAPDPTGGLRTIEAQFTSAAGTVSDVTEYFVEVSDLPAISIDLGPDQEACEGSETILDTDYPGAMYSWSTGEDTQTITVNQSGEYIVTVSNGIDCPGVDTVIIDMVPNIDVALTGDTYICDNEQATLTLQTDSPFPLTVTIEADPGSPFVFSGIEGTYSFTDLPFVTTTYTITEVIPDQPGCIVISDPEQVIEVYPTHVFENEVSMCDGDSIWLGYFWESNAGTYENLLESIYGCDSMVTTHITILPAVQIAQQSTTCDPSQTGVIITHLNNPIGCDTVVTTTITLLPSDTTMITLSSCSIAHTGITFDTLVNQLGCDSLIITTTTYIPPADSTYLYAETCDSTQIGVVYNITASINGCDSIIITNTTFALLDTTYLFATSCDSAMIGVMNDTTTGADGCDSLVITTTTFALADTTHLNVTSCDPSQVGVSQQTLTGQDGCDSLVITNTTFALADTTYLNAASCDPSQVGVSQHSTTGTDGCDSLVITTTTLLPSDAVSLFSTTCDPTQAGVYIHALTNQHGCDSIVTESITLLPIDAIFLSSTTCIASEAGVFVTTLTNQHGCDSIITSTVTLIPGDTTSFVFNTCDPALVGSTETIYTGQDGCDSLVIAVTGLYPLPQLTLQSVFDYNGFDISCIGDADGGAMAVIAGLPPYTYLWSTSATEAQITGISAGDYAVTITDSNGCTTDAVITLHQPTELMMGFEVTVPDCFDQALGIIRIHATGGVPPYTYAKDGGAVQASSEFDALGDGIYQFTVIDANGCSIAEIISIDVPLMISVDLGSDQSISLGDTTDIHAIVNLPLDSISHIVWSGIDTSSCVNCLHQIVAPIITTAYSITVSSVDGCSDRDTMTVSVTTDQHLYIPNIFSPNGDGVNDILRISADDGVQEISAMEIYDRWGNLVFGFTHKSPDDPAAQWDGLFRGERMNPGVFTYKAIIVYVTGEREVRYGDVTLVR